MKNIALKDVKNFAYLADKAYKDEKPTSDKYYNKDKHLPKDGTITNPATNSSFEVIEQVEYANGFSSTVFRNIPQRS